MNSRIKSIFKDLIFFLFVVGIIAVVDYFFIPENISNLVLNSVIWILFAIGLYVFVKFLKVSNDLKKDPEVEKLRIEMREQRPIKKR